MIEHSFAETLLLFVIYNGRKAFSDWIWARSLSKLADPKSRVRRKP